MTTIPYTVERRPDTGVNNVQLGIWLFLASEVMLFGGLFSAYFMLREGAPSPWLPLRDHLGGAAFATVLLLVATALIASSLRSVERYRGRLALAAFFALAFCAYKVDDYHHLVHAERGPESSTQMATFFLLTGVHLAHVLGGVFASAWVARRSGAAPVIAATANRLRALALYWYFVDVVWVVILVLLHVV
jgi:heme/copper-type cytochrome/quinol oxidase subunit 3